MLLILLSLALNSSSARTSAAYNHLRAFLGKYTLHPTNFLVLVHIVAGDEHNPVDYVFVSTDPMVTQEMCPDILEKVWSMLASVPGLWVIQVGKGPDRT